MNAGFDEYVKRLPKDYQPNLIEIPTIKRTKSSNIKQIMQIESQKLMANIPPQSLAIALDENGELWDTHALANKLLSWRNEFKNICLLIGGPDGWDKSCLKTIKPVWSLSKLTLPHQLVRVIVAEQIYRAWSIINKHPYHRN